MTANDKKWLIGGIIGAVILYGAIWYYRKRIVKGYQKVAEVIMLKPEQEAYIKDLHPKAQDKFRQFIKRVQDETGWSVLITSGYRSFQKQAQLKKEDSRNGSPGYSYHNYGLAIDLNLLKAGKRLMKASPRSEWEASGILKIAKDMGLFWGGDIKGYPDNVHFDVRPSIGITTKELYDKAIKQFGSADKAQGNQVQF